MNNNPNANIAQNSISAIRPSNTKSTIGQQILNNDTNYTKHGCACLHVDLLT